MSAIRVRRGSATVEVEALEFMAADIHGPVAVRYNATDLVAATVQALKSIDDPQAQEWLWAIENGAASRGLRAP